MANCSKVAANVIGKLGGFDAVAKILGINVSRVYRFTYERDRGGTDGLIPAKYQQRLLAFARANSLPLGPADFFDEPVKLECAE